MKLKGLWFASRRGRPQQSLQPHCKHRWLERARGRERERLLAVHRYTTLGGYMDDYLFITYVDSWTSLRDFPSLRSSISASHPAPHRPISPLLLLPDLKQTPRLLPIYCLSLTPPAFVSLLSLSTQLTSSPHARLWLIICVSNSW